MLTRLALLSLSLSWGGVLFAAPPEVDVPAKIAGAPGAFVVITAKTDAKAAQFYCIDPGLNLFPAGLLTDPKSTVATGPKGSYRVLVYAGNADGASVPKIVVVEINGGDVKPKPPAPKPPKPPAPVAPAPIPAPGLHVLVVYDALKLTTLSTAQQGAIYGKEVRDYLRATCPKGDDGETPEARMWPVDVDASGESKIWKDALARPRKSLPWVIVSNGKTGFEGPLPGSAAEMLKLLKTYGDK